jgi:hypothetical protein
VITWDFKPWPQQGQKQDWGLYAYDHGTVLNDSLPSLAGYFILSTYIPKHPPTGKLPGISGTAPNCDGSVTLNPTQQVADIFLSTGTIGAKADWHCYLHLSGGEQSKASWDRAPPPEAASKLTEEIKDRLSVRAQKPAEE